MPSHYNVTNPAKWMTAATDVYELNKLFRTAKYELPKVNAKADGTGTINKIIKERNHVARGFLFFFVCIYVDSVPAKRQ